MKFIIIIVVFLTGCSSTEESYFNIVNPKQDNSGWKQHVDLPSFDPEIHSDGCSGGMSAIYQQLKFLHSKHGKELSWRQCCVIHDQAYYFGGSKIQKRRADAELSSCVSEVVGTEYLGKAMQIAVKLGGSPNLPTSYRWGYGVDFIKK